MTGYNEDQITVREQFDKAVSDLNAAGFSSGIVELLQRIRADDEACVQEMLRRARRRSRPYVDRENMKATEMYAGLLVAARIELEWYKDIEAQSLMQQWADDPDWMHVLDLHINILREHSPEHELIELYDNYPNNEWLSREIARRFRDRSLSYEERRIAPDVRCFANMLCFVCWTVTHLSTKRHESKLA